MALVVLWLAMMWGGTGSLDRALLETLYVGHQPQLRAFMQSFTLLGNWPAVIAISLLAALSLLLTRHPRAALLLLGVSLTGRGLVELQKFAVHRPRPGELAHLVAVNSFSFPSAHAANSMILWLSLALLLPRREWRPAAAAATLPVTFLVGISRPMLGVHWPSDVVGGWAFGAAWVLALLALAERWPARR
ncbi:MAG: phosphatase PAP2 family protein [Sphingomicrobium sp.]